LPSSSTKVRWWRPVGDTEGKKFKLENVSFKNKPPCIGIGVVSAGDIILMRGLAAN
jgi:hypothetical protein